MIAALYVETGGVYFGLPDVDPWDEERDARMYRGPHPVVAHPPCARWSRLAKQVHSRGGPAPGEDGGCFASALQSVSEWGGVLEHPHGSQAWRAHGIPYPSRNGGWAIAGKNAWTCCVEQGHYGHRVRKPSWLYYVGTLPPELKWGVSQSEVQSDRRRTGSVQLLSRKQRKATPIAFRDLLLDLARSAGG